MKNIRCDVTHVHQDVIKNVKRSDELVLKNTSNLFKILGNETRLKIVDVLKENELCVCDIAVLIDMTQSAVSHQLSMMKKGGVVKYRKEGVIIYYSLNDNHIKDIYETAYNHIANCK
ncbi:metalloregulator ArsR/SmtB family transcription factor [Mycoplasmatota bacterium zrk1]